MWKQLSQQSIMRFRSKFSFCPARLQTITSQANWSQIFHIFLWTIEQGHIVLVEQLVQKHQNLISATDSKGRTGLYLAARRGFSEMVKMLLHYGADISCQTIDGTSALVTASQHGHCEVVEILLHSGADVNTTRGSGASALYLAAQEGHSNVVELLIRNNAMVDLAKTIGATPLYIASQNGHSRVVEVLLQHNANPNQERIAGTTPLHVATYEGHIKTVEALLSSRDLNVNKRRDNGQSALFIACYHRNTALLSLLLSHPDIEIHSSAVLVASQKGHVPVVRQLLDAGMDVDEILQDFDFQTPLNVAIRNSHVDLVEFLISRGADVNKLDQHGCSPLLLACKRRPAHLERIVKCLVAAGARTDVGESNPIHYACSLGNIQVVQVLLEETPSLVSQDAQQDNPTHSIFQGDLPIHVATRSGHYQLVKFLLSAGASPKAQTRAGETPAALAIRQRNYLLETILYRYYSPKSRFCAKGRRFLTSLAYRRNTLSNYFISTKSF